MIPQVDMFSFVLWKNLKTPKTHFKINWPLVSVHVFKLTDMLLENHCHCMSVVFRNTETIMDNSFYV